MPRSKKKSSKSREKSRSSNSGSYVPPSLDDDPPASSFPPPDNFVTQPPKQQGLTGKISTLFRKKSRTNSDSESSTDRGQSPSQGSVTSEGSSRRKVNQKKRIFYSSNDDDDSDDSYESASQSANQGTYHSYGTRSQSTANADRVVRFRGFSTSIRSLFLDEPLVCASMGCFGLLLSNRTEYFLELRNERRGLGNRKNRRRLPSRIVAYGLLVTMFLMFLTFLIWGFGTGSGIAEDYISGYDYIENNNNNNNGIDGTDDGSHDDQQWWDDYLQNNNENRYNNNAQYNYNDDYYGADDGNNNYYDGDDGNNGNNNQDDWNDQMIDDQYYADNNGDDQGYYNDDNGDDYYNGDDGNRRWLVSATPRVAIHPVSQRPVHHLTGICKVREYHEYLWQPIIEFVRGETEAYYEFQAQVKSNQRRMEDYAYNDDAYDDGNNGDDNNNADDGNNYNGNNGVDDVQQSSNGDGELMSDVQERLMERDIGADIRIMLLFGFLLFLGLLGRRRRMRTRFYIVRARAQEDHLYYASSDEAASRRVALDDTREDQYEGACSHTLCGCYPSDDITTTTESEHVEVTDGGIFRRKQRPHHEDSVARGFNCLMWFCCGAVCKCWFQCLSVCALAQEAREMRLLLPPRYQRVDFITHQPFHEYQKDVNKLRRGWMGRAERLKGFTPHLAALSRLSRYVLVLFVFSFAAIIATLMFNPLAAFSWQDAVVLIATFVQSFLVLFVVHWIFHKSDLSFDAVIKFFAAGFVVAVPTAVFFEGLLVNVVLFVAWMGYYAGELFGGEKFPIWVFDHWRMIWIIGELFNAYVVAAFVEELCKYYTFRAVEHPDLVFITGLQREEQDPDAVDGGLVKYPFASHQVQNFIRDHDDNGSSRSERSRGSSRKRDQLLHRTGTTDTEFDEDLSDVRSYRQKAMAITTAMISVAVGLACAENCLYVFVLGGALGQNNGNEELHKGDVMEAWIVLFFRSIFPVHALAAAMQSINMIRKFVESDSDSGHRIGVGRIVLPAIILHGTFDAILMGINVFVETAWDNYLEENQGNITDEDPYNALYVNLVAWISISVTMLLSLIWYFNENRKQRLRLILMEERDKALVGEGSSWTSGPSPRSREGKEFDYVCA